jgi:oligosaccharyl transferase complex subunit OST4
MITDEQLYKLALFLGTAAMLLIVLYHFLEVNSRESKQAEQVAAAEKKKPAKN